MGGGGSVGKSESDSSNSSQFNQDVWGPQGQALGGLYDSIGSTMGSLLGSPGGGGAGKGGGGGGGGKGGGSGMMGQIPGAVQQQQGIFNDANSAWGNQLQGGAYSGMDTQGQYESALGGGGNEQFMNESIMGGAGNNYVDAMKNQLQNDSNERLGQNLAMNDGRAAGYGQSGSSRHGITEGQLYDDSERSLSRQQTQMGFDTFDKDLDRKLGIAQRADQFDMGVLNTTSGNLQNANNAMTGGIDATGNMQGAGMGQFAPYSAPSNMMSGFANMIGSPTVLGSGSGSGSSNAKGFGASGQGGAGGGKGK